MSNSQDTKLPLPAFLKVLSSAEMPMSRAMSFAAKVYNTHNTPSELGKLTDEQLRTLGVDAKEDRRIALAAFKKAGYKPQAAVRDPVGVNGVAGPSKPGSKAMSTKKRKRSDNNVNELLPAPQVSGTFEFDEVHDEEMLKTKSAVVNRAPVMTAWATVVAERMGFKREEALSIASAYTEMNAISKGVALGLFDQRKGKGVELGTGESQPYVDLMGRRPVYTTISGAYRALLKGEPVDPSTPFSYISRSFRQTLPFVIGSMRMLAETYEPAELNAQAYGLYMEFRPDVENGKKGWGERAEVRCAEILRLKKARPKLKVEAVDDRNEAVGDEKPLDTNSEESVEEPPEKKAKSMSVEDYEATLDATINYDDLKFDDDF